MDLQRCKMVKWDYRSRDLYNGLDRNSVEICRGLHREFVSGSYPLSRGPNEKWNWGYMGLTGFKFRAQGLGLGSPK